MPKQLERWNFIPPEMGKAVGEVICGKDQEFHYVHAKCSVGVEQMVGWMSVGGQEM